MFISLLTVVAAAVLAAQPAPRFGLTQDGTAVLFAGSETIQADTEDGEPETLCSADVTVVRDLASGRETRFLYANEGKNCAGLMSKKGLDPRAKLDAFVAAHPLSSLRGVGPKGTKLVGLHAKCATFTCEGDACTAEYSGGAGCDDEGANFYEGNVDVVLKRADGRTYPVGQARVTVGMMGFRRVEHFEVSWLPGESKAAVIWSAIESGGRGGGDSIYGAELVDFSLVRVSVLGYADPKLKRDAKGHRPTAKDASDAAAEAIRKLGGFQVSTGRTRDAHTENVVFAAQGFEAEAKKVAGALGGVKVQPLNWKADADLVVACVAH